MHPVDLSDLCKKHGVELKDLPAFPKKMTTEQLTALVEMIGKSKKDKDIKK